MAKEDYLPLYEKCRFKYNFKRVLDILILLLLLLLLGYRVIYVNSLPWFIALLCESWFTISWVIAISTRWTPAVIKTYPDRLLQRLVKHELPAVDLFVTTADPVLEPPIITVNTVLSLLALDYPTHQLACYVSDDGCSPLTFYALEEASKFAKVWVPFCKKYHVQVRAPFRYFSDDPEACKREDSEEPAFKQEWLMMKDMYDQLSRKIEDATKKAISCQLDGDLALFSNTEKRNHPTIIQVIHENKENNSEGLPHLIYISREKRPKHPHHYKAGAMNVLTRVSGLMTNAPFTLNVDCDMFVNNPKIALHAMCVLLDPKGEKEVAFVQCPQQFYDPLKDDPFGNQMVVLFKYMGAGLAGLQGPFYVGTNCFHRRKVIYSVSPDNIAKGNNMSEKELLQKFGPSDELVKSAAQSLEGWTYSPNDINVFKSLEVASQVASCGYEYGTGWGSQVGWIYGSLTEDVLTGLTIHTKGWRSEMCTPEPIAFTGCAPRGTPTTLIQHKRWITGILEIFFSRHCPILGTLFGELQLRQCLAYLYFINWGLLPIFEICYACLLAYCIIVNSIMLPKGLGLCIPVAIFVIHKVHTLAEYIATGLSIRAWWNNQRMARMTAMNAGFSGFLSVLLKLLKISETVFDITKKDEAHSGGDDLDAGRFTFDKSPVFVPGTTILLVQLVALTIKLLGLQPQLATQNENGCGVGELLCSAYLIICYWPFLRGLFEKGKYGIPLATICMSAALAFSFLQLCTRSIVVDVA